MVREMLVKRLVNPVAYGITRYVLRDVGRTERVLAFREMRLKHEEEYGSKGAGFLTDAGKWALEYIPLVPIPIPSIIPPHFHWAFGLYDAISIAEGLDNKEMWGKKLDELDSKIFIASGLFPLTPAVPTREFLMSLRRRVEDRTFELWDK